MRACVIEDILWGFIYYFFLQLEKGVYRVQTGKRIVAALNLNECGWIGPDVQRP